MRNCVCGSTLAAGFCCFANDQWAKKPTTLVLKSVSAFGSQSQCYLKETNSCEGGISREHYLSKSILELMTDKNVIGLTGLRWLQPGETKELGVNSLVSNCLCKGHNQSLSSLDSAALKFFSALKDVAINPTPDPLFLCSGHDLERWFLKFLLGCCHSGVFSIDRKPVSKSFMHDLNFVEMFENPQSWPDGAGLYSLLQKGDVVPLAPRFAAGPIFDTRNAEVVGMVVDAFGLKLAMTLMKPQGNSFGEYKFADFRPEKFVFKQPNKKNVVQLFWFDNTPEHPTVEMAMGKFA